MAKTSICSTFSGKLNRLANYLAFFQLYLNFTRQSQIITSKNELFLISYICNSPVIVCEGRITGGDLWPNCHYAFSRALKKYSNFQVKIKILNLTIKNITLCKLTFIDLLLTQWSDADHTSYGICRFCHPLFFFSFSL